MNAQTSVNYSQPAPAIAFRRYPGSRFWGVYLNGDLLAVTVYKKGAKAITELISKTIRQMGTAPQGHL